MVEWRVCSDFVSKRQFITMTSCHHDLSSPEIKPKLIYKVTALVFLPKMRQSNITFEYYSTTRASEQGNKTRNKTHCHQIVLSL